MTIKPVAAVLPNAHADQARTRSSTLTMLSPRIAQDSHNYHAHNQQMYQPMHIPGTPPIALGRAPRMTPMMVPTAWFPVSSHPPHSAGPIISPSIARAAPMSMVRRMASEAQSAPTSPRTGEFDAMSIEPRTPRRFDSVLRMTTTICTARRDGLFFKFIEKIRHPKLTDHGTLKHRRVTSPSRLHLTTRTSMEGDKRTRKIANSTRDDTYIRRTTYFWRTLCEAAWRRKSCKGTSEQFARRRILEARRQGTRRGSQTQDATARSASNPPQRKTSGVEPVDPANATRNAVHFVVAVGEFKGWFSDLFSWGAHTYVVQVCSTNNLDAMRTETVRIPEQLGVSIALEDPDNNGGAAAAVACVWYRELDSIRLWYYNVIWRDPYVYRLVLQEGIKYGSSTTFVVRRSQMTYR
ncbi:hypothetical protein OG21DRAFT_1035803 [Imleria badia]|nr:hypothetical protein OG21DRAFT_1035803 [Imleria badia]